MIYLIHPGPIVSAAQQYQPLLHTAYFWPHEHQLEHVPAGLLRQSISMNKMRTLEVTQLKDILVAHLKPPKSLGNTHLPKFQQLC